MATDIIWKNNKKKSKLNLLLEKLLIDMPGILIYDTKGIFGGSGVKIRTAFLFEDNIKLLYMDTVKKIGKDNTDFLWYKSGKDIAFRYFSKHRKINNLKINKNILINELKNSSSFFIGMHLFDEIDIEFEKKRFVFKIKNKWQKKNFMFSYLSGVLSGFLGYLLNKNIETVFFLGDVNHKYKIIADVEFENVYIPSKENIKDNSLYSQHFSFNKKISSGLHTFSDFLRFKVIKIEDDEIIKLRDMELLPFEAGAPSIFLKNYELVGEGNLFRGSMIKSSEKVCLNLLKRHKGKREKIRSIRNILSALGLMEIYFTREEDVVMVSFLKKAFVLEKSVYVHLFINGFLNHLYGKKIRLIFEGQDKIIYKI